jgi:lysophospholipase
MHDSSMKSVDKFLKMPDGALLRYQTWLSQSSNNRKPRILILQGRATAIEKLEHVIIDLSQLGYEVWSFDWRGQGLSTRELGRRGYIDSYQTYLKDLHLFMKTFLKNNVENRPVVFLAQSMGAHIGLRYMVEYPRMIDAAFLTSPMLEINTGIYPKSLARAICKIMLLCGLKKRYIFGHGEYDPSLESFAGNLVTHNQKMFYYHRRLLMERPELILGGATFQWVAATLDSSKILLNEKYLKKIQVPVHIMLAEDERVVDNRMMRKVSGWIRRCSVEVVKGSRHQLLSEQPVIQKQVLNSLEQFVEYCVPIPHEKPITEHKQVYSRNKKKIVTKPAPKIC